MFDSGRLFDVSKNGREARPILSIPLASSIVECEEFPSH